MARGSHSRSPPHRSRRYYQDDNRGRPSDPDRRRRSPEPGYNGQRRDDEDRVARDKRRRDEDGDDERDHRRSRRDDDPRERRERREYDTRDYDPKSHRRRDDGDDNKDRDHRDGASSSRRRPGSPRPSAAHPPRSKSPSEQDKDKGKPNFNNSGLLAAETNAVQLSDGTSTLLKYNEPPEARKPTVGWRLYVFKGDDQSDVLHVNRQSCYLFGRDRTVADIPLEHPSSSKQHAVLQYRQIQQRDEFGSTKAAIKPFIIDLESTNGTIVNDEQIPPARYYELQVHDVVKFGLSAREYVLLHDKV